MMNHNHPFHLVTFSPWPFIISLSIFNNLICSISWFYNFHSPLLILSIPNTLICMYLWWRDVLREATYQGYHSIYVFKGMKIGMILFIISDILFYFFFLSMFSLIFSP